MLHRWSHLARHGLLGTALVSAAAGTARAEPCDYNAEQTIGFVLGLQFSPGVKVIGGIEGRKCMSDRSEAMLRLELGGGGPRLIAGARVRPFESWESNEDNLGVEAGLSLGLHAQFGVHLAGTYGTHSAYVAVQAHVQPSEQADTTRWSLLGGLAPWTAMGPTTVEGRPLVSDGHMLRPHVLWRGAAGERDRELQAVRDHFVSSAQLELSSVWTFLRLAAELAAVGAPAELVAAALDAADDEVRHAEQCGVLAGGVQLAELPAHAARARFTALTPEALATFVAEAWCEGCLNETAAAEEARLAGELADGPARDILAGIARDEQGHAELSWRVLAWAASIAPALAHSTIASLPPYASNEDAPPVDRALARHGVPTAAVTSAARAHAARVARARLAAIA